MTTLDEKEKRIVSLATETAMDIAYKMTIDDRNKDSDMLNSFRLQLIELTGKVEAGFKSLNEKQEELKTQTKENSESIKSLEETRSEQKGSLRIGSYLVNATVALGTAFLTALWTAKK